MTNAQFARFVADTGHVTVAERSPTPPTSRRRRRRPRSGIHGLHPNRRPCRPARLAPLVAVAARGVVASAVRPGSSADDRHPVVHVAYADARAYADWAGLRLPTEAEHEYAARGGRDGLRFAWGDEPYPDGVAQANTWLGRFPYQNLGVGGTSPVGTYPANGYGLFDLIGNVWEWTTDVYTPRHRPPDEVVVHPEGRPNLLAPRPPRHPAAS
ncbi:SUMF1/EgtB/PvdO family nonheme iron enzyme [Tessaracoccus sp.]|uniref:SUMF1/EgtB/PvdO family nonheme iron enzyme n=1 Tax=Tessaracoccus sp. TaxID=1971211 RepID=UPI002601BB2F|nr:SUMF1/EgtB/PvdO family nonheme iron enzyme [Tessaracoccus sp.]